MTRFAGTAQARQLLFFVAVALAPLPAQATIRYAVSVAQPENHQFRVTMTIPSVRN